MLLMRKIGGLEDREGVDGWFENEKKTINLIEYPNRERYSYRYPELLRGSFPARGQRSSGGSGRTLLLD